MKKIKPILLRLDEEVYAKILEAVHEAGGASNGKFGSGVAGFIKNLLHENFNIPKSTYHTSKRGPRKKVDSELERLFES